jgi:hypothetical protein
MKYWELMINLSLGCGAGVMRYCPFCKSIGGDPSVQFFWLAQQKLRPMRLVKQKQQEKDI